MSFSQSVLCFTSLSRLGLMRAIFITPYKQRTKNLSVCLSCTGFCSTYPTLPCAEMASVLYIFLKQKRFSTGHTPVLFGVQRTSGAGNIYRSDGWKWRELYCIRSAFSVMRAAIFHIALFTYSETNLGRKERRLGRKDKRCITPFRVRQQPELARK